MYDFEEACPVSKAASVLCERWTLQIIREMLFGASRFSEFQKYLPKMSPSLLNTRLRTLEDEGLIIRKRIPEKKGFEYQLTPCGLALKPVIESIGRWGMQWVFDKMDPEEMNLSVLVRDFAVTLNTDALPSGDTVIQFNISHNDQIDKRYVTVRDGCTQVCEDNIGTEVDVFLTTNLETLGKLWYGEIDVIRAQEIGLLKAVGPSVYTRHLSRWLGKSQFAGIKAGTTH